MSSGESKRPSHGCLRCSLRKRVCQKLFRIQSTTIRFHSFQGAAKRLYDEARMFKDSLSLMLGHQEAFAQTWHEMYMGIGQRRESTEEGRTSEGESGRRSAQSVRSADPTVAREKLDGTQAFADAMLSARSSLLPDLNVERLLDYDRHRDAHKKLRERSDQDVKDEKRLAQIEVSLEAAQREYNAVNSLLVSELPPAAPGAPQSVYRTVLPDPVLDAQAQSAQVLPAGPAAKISDHDVGFDTGYHTISPSSAEAASPPSASSAPPPYAAGETGSSERLARGLTNKISASFASMNAAAGASWGANDGKAANASSSPAPVSAPRPPKVSGHLVMALYDSSAKTHDELSFKRDDLIEVVERTADTNDWWTGRIRGKVGMFPAKHVTEI
ncbi:hypothetical protein BJ742DRAFT_859491 [Cladochytrium replicatum]|nr:hypothetical protein BJ742DRAFT_859491 [Cladochytrium replicatum]